MHVLHISDKGWRGGAAKAAHRIHEGLERAGTPSRMIAGDFSGDREDHIPLRAGRRWHWQVVERFVGLAERKLRLQNLLSFDPLFGNSCYFAWADVVNLHNIHSMSFNPLALPRLSAKRPLVWTLHDMWAMTGHCGFPLDCRGWLQGCSSCPRPNEHPPADRDRIGWMFRVKDFLYSKSVIELATPSEWVAAQARKSPLLRRFRVTAIPYGLDTDVFHPVHREAAKRVFGLSPDRLVIVTGAFTLGVRRKGIDLLLEALRNLRADARLNLSVLAFGLAGEELVRACPCPVVNVGYVENEQLMSILYSAGDVFVGPSRAETFGQVFSESMACGTPCVAFRVGGVSEVVRDGETGYLARPEDAVDLARCIRRILTDDRARLRMAARSREVAEREYNLDLQARRYVRLYEEAIEKRKR